MTFFISLLILSVGLYFIDLRGPLFDGFGGNLTAGIIGGFQFLFLALYLDANTEEKIDHIKKLVEKSEKLVSKREEILEVERDIHQFEHFLKYENWHNVRFPDVKDNDGHGLEYTIRPVRDGQTNEPIQLKKEMGDYYLIQVIGPASEAFLSSELLDVYEKSPIRDQEYYFCAYINRSWSMGSRDVFEFPFYLSSKMGEVEESIAANKFMEKYVSRDRKCQRIRSWRRFREY
jgi:hypothetical protein